MKPHLNHTRHCPIPTNPDPFRPMQSLPLFPTTPPWPKRKPRFHGVLKMVEAEGLEPTTR